MTDVNKILSTAYLDILFDGKNKAYGAYNLRKTYNKRLVIALSATVVVCLFFFLGSVLGNSGKKKDENLAVKDMTLAEVPKNTPRPIEPPPVEQPKPAEPPKIKMEQFTPPEIVQDDQVEKAPPKQTDLENAVISTISQEGMVVEEVFAPPVEKSSGNSIAPVQKVQNFDTVFTHVEIPARFPGGPDAWRRHLERAMQNYPEQAVDNGTQGLVRIQFVIDREGNISEVKALNDPGDGIAAYAVSIIQKGPKWIPAEQNGQKVSYRHIQAITFQLQ